MKALFIATMPIGALTSALTMVVPLLVPPRPEKKKKRKEKKTAHSQQKRKEKYKQCSARFLFFIFFVGNLWRWNNGGGAMEEEIERGKRTFRM